jgi:hypothetical protein
MPPLLAINRRHFDDRPARPAILTVLAASLLLTIGFSLVIDIRESRRGPVMARPTHVASQSQPWSRLPVGARLPVTVPPAIALR